MRKENKMEALNAQDIATTLGIGFFALFVILKIVKSVISRVATAVAAAVLASYFGIHLF